VPRDRRSDRDGSARGPTPIGEALDRVLAGLGAPPASALERVIRAWPDLVGPAAAEALRPVAVRDGELVVTADDPAWVGQARWLEDGVVSGLADVLGPGVVTRLRARRPARRS